MKSSSYRQIVQLLESKSIMPDRAPSLIPTKEGLKRIIDLKSIDPKKVIVVAGTNGKGSICATLEALFLSAGETVGVYTSPHLEETTERIRLNGQDITQDLFCEAFHEVAKKTDDLNLTHFEFLTLMSCWVFFTPSASKPIERFIFEVGLGGTWDATNAIPHQNCIIASLGYDHQNLLGHSLSQIALNKFGIVTQNSIVVHSPLPADVQEQARLIHDQTQSLWVESIPHACQVRPTPHGPLFSIETPWGTAPIALAGPRGAQNTATALTLFKELGFSPQAHFSSLSQVRWPGRMEKYEIPQSACPIYLSGDHNTNGIASLLELLSFYPRSHLYILAAVVIDKDLDGILLPLANLPDSSLFLTETSFRKRPLESYGPWLKRARNGWSRPEQAFKNILAMATKDDLILVTGSLYLVGEIKSHLTQQKSSCSILS